MSGKALAAGTGQERQRSRHRWLAPLGSGETAEPYWFAPAELVVYGRGITTARFQVTVGSRCLRVSPTDQSRPHRRGDPT